jgi:hypothetical protein
MVIEPDAPNNLIVGVFANTGANDGGAYALDFTGSGMHFP